MNKSLEQVVEFHKEFNHKIGNKPQALDSKNRMFRLAFIREELDELYRACLNNDIKEVLDAFCDIQYVLNGAIINAGMQDIFDEAMDEVHRSNMSKSYDNMALALASCPDGCTVQETKGGRFITIRDSDGKVIKATTYSPVDFSKILKLDGENN